MTEEVRQFLELWKEKNSKDDPINPKMDKILAEVDKLQRQISEFVKRPPGEMSTSLSKHQVQGEETNEEK